MPPGRSRIVTARSSHGVGAVTASPTRSTPPDLAVRRLDSHVGGPGPPLAYSLDASAGERLSFAGAVFLVQASAESTGGAFSIIEEIDPLDTPLHVHANEVLRVHAIHEDVKFTRTVTKAVQAELEDLGSWLGLSAVEPA